MFNLLIFISIISLLTCQVIICCPWLKGLCPSAAHQTHRHGNTSNTSRLTSDCFKSFKVRVARVQRVKRRKKEGRKEWRTQQDSVSSVTLTGIKGLEGRMICVSHIHLHSEVNEGNECMLIQRKYAELFFFL